MRHIILAHQRIRTPLSHSNLTVVKGHFHRHPHNVDVLNTGVKRDFLFPHTDFPTNLCPEDWDQSHLIFRVYVLMSSVLPRCCFIWQKSLVENPTTRPPSERTSKYANQDRVHQHTILARKEFWSKLWIQTRALVSRQEFLRAKVICPAPLEPKARYSPPRIEKVWIARHRSIETL